MLSWDKPARHLSSLVPSVAFSKRIILEGGYKESFYCKASTLFGRHRFKKENRFCTASFQDALAVPCEVVSGSFSMADFPKHFFSRR